MKLPSAVGGRFPGWLRIGLWLLCWAAAGWVKLGYHELWKDEWQAWLMARDMGWWELLRALYYEGHPALWYLFLKFWTLPGWSEVWAIQSAHFLLAGVAGGLFWYFTRLSWWLSALLWLGYFPFFEYGVVNRGYILVMIFGIALAGWLERPERKGWLLAMGMLSLCQTEVYGVLMGGALLVYAFFKHGRWGVLKNKWFKGLLGGWVVGFLVFGISVFPRESGEELAHAYVGKPFGTEVLGTAFQGNWANAFLIGSVPDTNAYGVGLPGLTLSVVVLLGMMWFFRKAGAVAWAFWIFQLVFFLFSALIYTGGVRHWGMILVCLMLMLQLWSHEKPSWGLAEWLILGSVLFFQVRYAGLAVDREVRYPFSNAVAAGTYIKKEIPEGAPVVAINKFEATPVLGYAGRSFYALPEGEPFTYFRWVEKVYLPPEEELMLFAAYKRVDMLVVLSPRPLDAARYPNARLIRAFDGPNLKRENYYLYAFRR